MIGLITAFLFLGLGNLIQHWKISRLELRIARLEAIHLLRKTRGL